jgi:hypothetical protein
MSDEGPKKEGEVVKFPAPKETEVGKFEFIVDTWLRDRGPIVESGTEKNFQEIALSLSEGLVAYGKNQPNPNLIANMAARFMELRREWGRKADTAATEAEKDVARTIALRYDELASIVNKYLRDRGS